MPRPLPDSILSSTGGEAEAVRGHILDAALRVITTHGLAAASTRAIATEAGVGAGTIYNYFDDRLQLLAHAILHRAKTLAKPLSDLASYAGKDSVAHNLREVAHHAANILDELVPLLAAAFSDSDLLRVLRKEMSHGVSVDPIRPITQYLLAERKLGRISPEADCQAAAATLVDVFHNRAFQRHLHAETGKWKAPIKEIELVVRALEAH